MITMPGKRRILSRTPPDETISSWENFTEQDYIIWNKDCTSQGYLSSRSPHRGRVMTVPVVPPRYVNVVYLGALNIAAWCTTYKSGERIIVCTWCVLEEEPTERCEGSTKDR